VRAGTRAAPWAVTGGMVTFDGRLYIPSTSPLLPEIMAAVHADGHEGGAPHTPPAAARLPLPQHEAAGAGLRASVRHMPAVQV
jgi:hypothetical protein